MAYTPGVARICNAIAEEPDEVHKLTIKKNSVAIVTDGTAVLGLGDIGPEASLPVMEGKALLFKEFAGIDAFPICLRVDRSDGPDGARGADQLVEAVERLSPVFGGVNLEDIAAPRASRWRSGSRPASTSRSSTTTSTGQPWSCSLRSGNSLKIVGKEMADLKVVIAGVGRPAWPSRRSSSRPGCRT
jgi:malate dehydrogenase (oxaloacetate-decarboxylating)